MKRKARNPWDRQPEESAQAYAAFVLYLETPDRSLPKMLQSYPKSLDNIKKLSARWSWLERAAAYDSSIVEEARREKIRRLKKIIERKNTLGTLMMDKAEEMLHTISMSRGSFRAAADLADIGSRLVTEAFELDSGQEDEKRELTINIVSAEKNSSHEGG